MATPQPKKTQLQLLSPQLLRLLFFTGTLQFCMIFYEWIPGLDDNLETTFELHYVFMACTGGLVWFWYKYLKRLEESREELNHLRRVADNASQAKTAFLANISHEIRTPLNGVIGMLGLLSQMQLTERQREYVDTIRKSSEQLLLVINDVLDIAKIEAGQLMLETIAFDISVAANDVVETFVMDCQRKNLQINIRHQAGMPTRVMGDPGRVRQILTNLIGNAIKFTQVGHIYINVSLAENGLMGDKARFTLSVEDTGIGIPKSKQKEVFERFSQADASTTRRFGGTGLGLSITRELVRLMNGTMYLCSEENKGSIFTVTITLPLDKTDYISKYALPSADSLRGLRALVADDSLITRRIMREMLSLHGVSVEETSTAAETVDKLKSGRVFDMVLLDNTLPDSDALTLGHQIHAMSNAMMVVHTSMGQRGDAGKFEQAGFAAYILKPFTYAEFTEILALAYARKQAGKDGILNYPTTIITRHMVKDLKENGPKRTVAPQTDFGQVLIVEDDKVNQLVLNEILMKLGARTQIAENGQEGVELCTRQTFGLILMDMNMPFMNGPDATRAIRKMETDQGRTPMPIVALTANAMKEHRDICLSAGMNDYLTKPVTVDKLKQVLQKWINEKEVAAAQQAETLPASPAFISNDDASPPLDLTFLNNLTDNNAETKQRLFSLFFENASKSIATLEDAPIGTEEWKKAAHKLKGSAASLGAFPFSTICADAEFAELGSNKEEILDQINACYNNVREYCEKQRLI